MKVFIPHKKDRNVYFDEIINFSKCQFIYGDFKNFNLDYDVVNIQFPEAIFNWSAPTEAELEDLEKELLIWKKYSKIVLTLNDAKSHYDLENKYNDLFTLIQKNVDGVIHLGNYSLENYSQCFSKGCKQVVIFHPLYESLLSNYKTQNIENKFSVDFESKFVVVAIGAIRSIEEFKLILKMFKNIPNKNKLLIVPNQFNFAKRPDYIPYRFRKIYTYLIHKYYCFPLIKSQYFFGYKFIDYEFMVDLVEKSSLILIPRIKNLNSGNLFLGLTFDKPMIIPKIGNLSEVATFFNLPVIDLSKKNFKQEINKTLELINKDHYFENEYINKKKKFSPTIIAAEYDTFFKSITNR